MMRDDRHVPATGGRMALKPYRANMSFSVPGMGPWRYGEVQAIDPNDPAWSVYITEGYIVPVEATYDEPPGRTASSSSESTGDTAD